MVATVNLSINQSTTFSQSYSVRDRGVPVDITGYTIKAQAKKYFVSFVAFTFAVELTDPENGVFTISMTDIQTRDLPPGRLLYDIKMTDTNGVSSRIFDGNIDVVPSITDSNPFVTTQGVRITDPQVVHVHTNKEVLDVIEKPVRKWKPVSTSGYIVQNGDLLMVDTSAAQIQLVVPAEPEDSFEVTTMDLSDTFGLNTVVVVDENDQPVYEETATGARFTLVYVNATHGWKIIQG